MRGEIVGYDEERLAFKFTMLDNDRVVNCQISDAAMDELAGMKATESFARRALFLSLRSTIEQIASELFDQEARMNGHVVRIFTKHIPKQRSRTLE